MAKDNLFGIPIISCDFGKDGMCHMVSLNPDGSIYDIVEVTQENT